MVVDILVEGRSIIPGWPLAGVKLVVILHGALSAEALAWSVDCLLWRLLPVGTDSSIEGAWKLLVANSAYGSLVRESLLLGWELLIAKSLVILVYTWSLHTTLVLREYTWSGAKGLSI